MKLLVCPRCTDVVKLKVGIIRCCDCGASFGQYIDELNAEYGGEAIPLGFSNPSLLDALKERDCKIRDGEEANQQWGIRFEAFTIPTGAPSVKMLDGVKTIFRERPKTEAELIAEIYGSLAGAI